MRRGASSITVGTILLIVAVAGFVIVPQHRPGATVVEKPASQVPGCIPAGGASGLTCEATVPTGWSRSLYDAVLIASWAVLIIGIVLVAVGLIRFANQR